MYKVVVQWRESKEELVYGSLLEYRMVLVVALAFMAGLLPLFVFGKPASGATVLPAGFEESLFASGLTRPTAMEFAPDGRLFVTEIQGTLRVIEEDGDLLETPFVDVSDEVDPNGGRGLLGVTFHPDFEAGSPYVYVHYTQKASEGDPAHNIVVRYTADGDQAEAGSELLIFEMDDLGDSTKHNGGAIHFGADGKLYIPTGDNKRDRTAQKLTSTLGKVLRVEPDGSIPDDNPFLDQTSGTDQAIWALGFRNPFTFAVQPGTGKIHINDVGQQTWEEINKGKAGANYGWPFEEGHDDQPGYKDPIFAYKHDKLPNTPPETSGCAITGGAFYNPPTVQFPASYVGDYFFTDLCNGWIRRLEADGSKARDFATSTNQPVDLKVGEDGSLYYLELGGSIHEIEHPGS